MLKKFRVPTIRKVWIILIGVVVGIGSNSISLAQNTEGMGITRTVEEIMAEQASVVVPATRQQLPEREAKLNKQPNPDSPLTSSSATSGVTTEQIERDRTAPQSVAFQFTSTTSSDSPYAPPDTMGAVGTTEFVTHVNGRIRANSKTTGAVLGLNADPDVFFSSVTSDPTGDPRIRFDPITDRWFTIAFDIPPTAGNANNNILIAVSDDDTAATGSWTFFKFRQDVSPGGDTTCFADYPTLAIDVNALYIGTNQFCGSVGGFYKTSNLYVVQKSSILGAGPIVANAFYNLVNPTTFVGPYTPHGVDNFDPSATVGYVIGVDAAQFGLLQLRIITNPGTATPSISSNISLSIAATRYPLNAPHPGGIVPLDAIDDRIMAAFMHNGHIWTSHSVGVNGSGVSSAPNRTAVRWYEINPVTPTVVQFGTVFDSAASSPKFYFMGTIMVSGQGHAALGATVSGVTQNASAVTFGRLATDAAGTTRTPLIYHTGVANYDYITNDSGSAYRWGDYSYTSLDPCDNMTMWTIQEYAHGTASWGTRVAKLLAPPPPVLPATIASVTLGEPSIALNVSGTTSGGQGFYDPGVGFGCRLNVSANNGIVVSNFTYVAPNQVSVTLDMSGVSTVGNAILTITNPDGQIVTTQINVLPPTQAVERNYFTTGTPTLTWNRVTGAVRYEVQVSLSSTFAILSFPTATVDASALAFVTPSLADGLYYWRVRSCTSALPTSCGVYSASETFRIDVP